MAFEEINVNMSLTGSQAVVQEILNYIKNMAEASKVTANFSASAGKAGASLGAIGKEMGAAAGEAERYGRAAAVAKTEADRMAAAQDRAAAAYMRETHEIERATQATLLQRDALVANMKKQQTAMQAFANGAPKLNRMAVWSMGLIGGAVYEGIKQYTDFNKKMVQASTEAGIAFDKQAQLTKNIGQIAKDTGRSYNDLADALYRVGSATSGWNGGKGATTSQITDLVRQTANLATIGNLGSGAQSDQAARVIGAVVNSGMAQGGTKNAAAQINAIVGAGDIRMSEFITALGRGVLTSGKSVGLNLQQVGAYVDLLTSRGVTGASAGTYVAHAFQLLSGSTKQAADIQAALGISSGQMTDIMSKQGLGPAVQFLYQHMQKLQAVPYLKYQGATGQAAAEKMMLNMGLSPDQVAAMEQGLAPGSDMQRAVMQRLMTGMFGGGRQAMPLMTLLQTSGINVTALDQAMGGYMAKGPSYQDILKNIQSHSTTAHYDEVLKASLNTPAAQQARLMRQLQSSFIDFGKTVYPIWINLLHGVTVLVSGLMKLKGALYAVAAAVGGLLIAAGVKGAASLAMRAKDTIGAAAYWRTRGLARLAGEDLTNVKLGKYAEAYAGKRGLEGSEVYRNQLRQIAIAEEQLLTLRSILAARESNALISSLPKGGSKGLLRQGLRNEQRFEQLGRGLPEGYVKGPSGLLLPTSRASRTLSSAELAAVDFSKMSTVGRAASQGGGILSRLGGLIGLGGKAAGVAEEVGSVAGKAGMLSRLVGLGGGAAGMLAGGGLRGLLGTALGIGTGPVGMTLMTGLALAPVIAPMAKGIFNAIGGGLGRLFGGGQSNTPAPPPPPAPPLPPAKSLPPNAQKLQDSHKTLNKQLQSAKQHGQYGSELAIEQQIMDTESLYAGITSDDPTTRYLATVSMARNSYKYNEGQWVTEHYRKNGRNRTRRVRPKGWKQQDLPEWARTQQEKDFANAVAVNKYLQSLQSYDQFTKGVAGSLNAPEMGGKTFARGGWFGAGKQRTYVSAQDMQSAMDNADLIGRQVAAGVVPTLYNAQGKAIRGTSALLDNQNALIKGAKTPKQLEATYTAFRTQQGLEYTRAMRLHERAQKELAKDPKKAAMDEAAAKALEDKVKKLGDAADKLQKNMKLDPASMSALAQEIGDNVRRAIGKRTVDGGARK